MKTWVSVIRIGMLVSILLFPGGLRALFPTSRDSGRELQRAAPIAASADAEASRRSIGAAGRAKFESTELCYVYVDLHAILALAIGNGS